MSSRIRLILMDHFPRAIALITEAMKKGETTPHDKPWKEMTEEEIYSHMTGHRLSYAMRRSIRRHHEQMGIPEFDDEDHLLHMICRDLMLLEKREKSE